MSASGFEPLGSPRSGQSRRRADQEAAPYAPPDMARSPSKAAALVAEPYQSAVKSMETTHRTILMLRCKVVVVGDATVGKSALISMFHSGGACARARRARETVWKPRSAAGTSYPKQYVMTSWVDFRVKQVNIPDTSTAVELYLFDCAGQSIFNQIEANNGAAKEREIPNFKGSYLGRFPLVSADFWTSDHLSERSRRMDTFPGTRARGTLALKRR